MKNTKSFASDNCAGVHPDILKAIAVANNGHALSYGDDDLTPQAHSLVRDHFGDDIDIYFVFNGTGANVIGLKSITQPFHSIICAETAHINVDECGAVEHFTGCKLITVPTSNGKLCPEQIKPLIKNIDDQHHSQPKVVSISQSTEWGTVYSIDEIAQLSRLCHQHEMLLHMDGSRLCNAAASLNCSLRETSADAGVDVLSFGGTKNGLLLGEALIFFDPHLGQYCKFYRKQAMHLASKMRFFSAQFIALLSNDLWKRNASHANMMAQLLASEMEKLPNFVLVQKVQANAVFVSLPPQLIAPLQQHYFFHVWDEKQSIGRFMCAFDTTQEDIYNFVLIVKDLLTR
ncbi:MAG: low specificity L-threonine aldolase [Chitinivibrionales bacterium]|nr:low specificity L-threonine aldolase [Chitinivibrionales bacterium]